MKKFIDCAFKIIFSRTLIIIVMILLQIMVLLAGFTWLGRSMSFIWEIMNVLGALLVIHIINKDEPTEFKMSWIIIICLLPVLGALIYLLVVGNFGGLGLKKRLQECARETEGLVETSKETGLAITQSSSRALPIIWNRRQAFLFIIIPRQSISRAGRKSSGIFWRN